MKVLSTKIRKANKNHKCNFCSGLINKGDKYDWQKISMMVLFTYGKRIHRVLI